jgi:hypothetical protein
MKKYLLPFLISLVVSMMFNIIQIYIHHDITFLNGWFSCSAWFLVFNHYYYKERKEKEKI